jgi:adenine-specific DNA-methyltransferase
MAYMTRLGLWGPGTSFPAGFQEFMQEIESGGVDKIAVWMLDTDYDQRALFPRQVFFPMSGEKDGWSRLARNLKAEIDEDLIEAYRGNVSLPFESKPGKYVALKIVDDRGIESLKIFEVES